MTIAEKLFEVQRENSELRSKVCELEWTVTELRTELARHHRDFGKIRDIVG